MQETLLDDTNTADKWTLYNRLKWTKIVTKQDVATNDTRGQVKIHKHKQPVGILELGYHTHLYASAKNI